VEAQEVGEFLAVCRVFVNAELSNKYTANIINSFRLFGVTHSKSKVLELSAFQLIMTMPTVTEASVQ